MIPWLSSVLWDSVAAKALLVWLSGVFVAFMLQPGNRPTWERIGWGVVAGLPGAYGSLPSATSKRAEAATVINTAALVDAGMVAPAPEPPKP